MALTEVSWAPRQPGIISPSVSVCRCLFGPVNHTEIQADLRREMKTMNESMARKWNFDFERESPLNGRFLWHKTTGNSNVQTTGSTSNDDFNSRASNTRITTRTRCENPKIQTTKVSEKKPRRRPSSTKITEFLRQQKPRSCKASERRGVPENTTKHTQSSSRPKKMCLDKFFK